jgi:(E)-4-hydroxy-3-methyl-but-2-enyl pyrophosphate reductase
MHSKFKILRAKKIGFCFGVKHAVKLAEKFAPATTIGELTHNPAVLAQLKKIGILAKKFNKIKNETAIIRAHGISQKKILKLKKRGVKIIDASCPFVRKIHATINKFHKQKIPIIIVGKKTHPEIQAICEDFPEILVVRNARNPQLKNFAQQSVGLLAQTTETPKNFQAVKKFLQNYQTQVQALDTICHATRARQQATIQLAKKVDLLFVIGSKKSNNSRQLYQLAQKITPTIFLESEKKICQKLLKNKNKIGLATGASTPEFLLKKVEQKIKTLAKKKKSE